MRKFVYVLILYALLTTAALLSSIIGGEIQRFQRIAKNSGEFVFLREEIGNKTNFRDRILPDVVVNGIFAMRRNVWVYQWVEERKLLEGKVSYVYIYKKCWSDKPIDSSGFHDKNKRNPIEDMNGPKSYRGETIFNGNIITKNGFELDKKYFVKDLGYKKFLFKDPKVVYVSSVSGKKGRPKPKLENTYVDLDSYTGDTDLEKKTFQSSPDRFKVVDRYILYNGKNFSNPEIGDIKIEYEFFSPKTISFFGTIRDRELIPHNGLVRIDSDIKTIDELVASCRVEMIKKITLILLLLLLVIDLIFKIIQEDLRIYFLNVIPFFGEYFLFGGRKYAPPLVLLIATGTAMGSYLLSTIALLILSALGYMFSKGRSGRVQ
ncbi:MAG: TMEM43 family protein [Rickettsiales bacterium]|jgi:hypothetical protein|nr:TMEM43 family protein [Rickettsiales bacterium]